MPVLADLFRCTHHGVSRTGGQAAAPAAAAPQLDPQSCTPFEHRSTDALQSAGKRCRRSANQSRATFLGVIRGVNAGVIRHKSRKRPATQIWQLPSTSRSKGSCRTTRGARSATLPTTDIPRRKRLTDSWLQRERRRRDRRTPKPFSRRTERSEVEREKGFEPSTGL